MHGGYPSDYENVMEGKTLLEGREINLNYDKDSGKDADFLDRVSIKAEVDASSMLEESNISRVEKEMKEYLDTLREKKK